VLELEGAAGELSFPGFPLTTAEAKELSQKLAGNASLRLIYDPANTTFTGGSFHYVAPAGAPPAFEIVVSNASGTSTFTFSEYRLFIDDTADLDTMVFTPVLPVDDTITLSSGTTVDIDIGLVWQDPSGTILTSSTLPATLDLDLLSIRGYSFIFVMPDGTGNGLVKGGFRKP
jgi:hypothetical protein